MARPKGSKNKAITITDAYTLTPEQRLQLIATLLIEIVSEEVCKN